MKIIQQCYQLRFSEQEREKRNLLWKNLCKNFLQRFIRKSDVVLDVGAGYCEFINNISCKKKIVVDINPDVREFAHKNVEIVVDTISHVPSKLQGTIDVVFMSNFLEHLNSKDEVIEVLQKVNALLKIGGKVLIMQPNISLVKERYWDFIDHKTPLNEISLKEALTLCNFDVKVCVKRFLPYSTKEGSLRNFDFLLGVYLKIPSILRPFAGQSFVLAIKSEK